jgi:hypothetical protein
MTKYLIISGVAFAVLYLAQPGRPLAGVVNSLTLK